MKQTEGTFQGAGGLELYYKNWFPDVAPRAVVMIAHGVGEHVGRYEKNVVNTFVPHGYAVAGFDQRGHGRSPGQRGHINRWAEYREDTKAFFLMVKDQNPACLIFLYGHSMGALIALDYIMHHPEGLHGAIISGAPIQPVGVSKPTLVALARLMSNIWPTFTIKLGLETAALARDPDVVKAYNEDPLVHGMVTARWGTEALATVAWVKENAVEIRIPILLVHGEADRLNSADGARQFEETVPYSDKVLYIDPGGYHEPHNDLAHDQVLKFIENWMDQHL
jgi:alpha-beta hydrolase superfamily lysophospholipase